MASKWMGIFTRETTHARPGPGQRRYNSRSTASRKTPWNFSPTCN